MYINHGKTYFGDVDISLGLAEPKQNQQFFFEKLCLKFFGQLILFPYFTPQLQASFSHRKQCWQHKFFLFFSVAPFFGDPFPSAPMTSAEVTFVIIDKSDNKTKVWNALISVAALAWFSFWTLYKVEVALRLLKECPVANMT